MKKEYAIGIDVGATKMDAVLFNGEKVVADYTLATPKDTLEHFLIMIVALIEPLLEKAKKDRSRIKGVGLGVAGVIDNNTGTMLRSPNLPLIDGKKLARLVGNKISLPTAMDNDANCFVRAEARMGAGKKYRSVYGITIGSGVGGGWHVDGRIYRENGSGEPGHMLVDFENNFDLEKAYQDMTHGDPAKLADEAFNGDVRARQQYEAIGKLFGKAFANIANLIAPEIFIIGGGVAMSCDLFLPEVQKTMREYILSSELKKRLRVVKGKLGTHAGAIGAASLVE